MRIKLLEQIEQKAIPIIRLFLEILKSDENFRGFGYLAEMVEKDFDRLVEEEKVPTTNGKQQAEFSCHYCEHDDISRTNTNCQVRLSVNLGRLFNFLNLQLFMQYQLL